MTGSGGFRWESSGLVIVASVSIMKTSDKLLRALGFLALNLLLLPVLWLLAEALMGGSL